MKNIGIFNKLICIIICQSGIMKRSKNIFNSMIAPENLLESEGNRENKIGELPINSNWLKGVRA